MKRINIVLLSLLSAFIIMSSGYGIWQKDLSIEGDLDFVADPEVIKALEAELEDLEFRLMGLETDLEGKLEEQRIEEELNVLEELKLIEEHKLLEVELNEVQDNEGLEQTGSIETDDEPREEIIQNNFKDIETIVVPIENNVNESEEVSIVENNNEANESQDDNPDN